MPVIPDFQPLWKQKGIKDPAHHNKFGEGLAWNALTVADVMAGFTAQYANWSRVGPIVSSLTILSYAKEAQKRMGVPQDVFLKIAVPVIIKVLQFHAATTLVKVPAEGMEAAVGQYARMLEAGFNMAASQLGQEGAAFQAMLLPQLMTALKNSSPWIAANRFESARQAQRAFNRAVQAELDAARALKPKLDIDAAFNAHEKYVQYYSPPHIVMMISNGLWKTDPLVTVETVATSVAAGEARRQTAPTVLQPRNSPAPQ